MWRLLILALSIGLSSVGYSETYTKDENGNIFNEDGFVVNSWKPNPKNTKVVAQSLEGNRVVLQALANIKYGNKNA